MLFRMALNRSLLLNDNRKIAESLLAMGNLYAHTQDYEATSKYYGQALAFAMKAAPRDERFIQMLRNNVAMTYTYMGLHREAAEYYYAGIASTGVPVVKAALYLNLSITQSALGDYGKALHYIGEAEHIAIHYAGVAHLRPYIYVNKGDILLSRGDADSALQAGLQALQLAGAHPPKDLLHEIYTLLGKVYMHKGMPERALGYHRKALALTAGFPMGHMRSSLALGTIYLDIRQYDSAEHYLAAALQQAGGTRLPQELVEIHNRLADLYLATHRYREAVGQLQTATTLKDSAVNIEKMRFVNLMDIKYQTAEKNKELAEKQLLIAQQHAYIVRKNMWIAGLSVAALLVIAGSWLFYGYRQRLQQHREEITAWRARAEGEEQERTRIARELHDSIGGALSTMKMYFSLVRKQHAALAATADYREAMQLLDHTLIEVRNTAHNLMPELLLRHGLPEAVRIFCRNITTGSDLKIDYQYYGFRDRLDGNLELAVYRIIQELVQNIRKHAQATQALVQLSQHHHILSGTVEDNGIGMDTDTARHDGLGLESIGHRISGLHGTFSVRSAKGKGTTVYFEINLQNV